MQSGGPGGGGGTGVRMQKKLQRRNLTVFLKVTFSLSSDDSGLKFDSFNHIFNSNNGNKEFIANYIEHKFVDILIQNIWFNVHHMFLLVMLY